MKQLQRTSKISETLKTYAYNMSFHRNISLLRLRVAARNELERGAQCVASWSRRGGDGVWHDDGSRVAWDGVRGREDGSSERTTQ